MAETKISPQEMPKGLTGGDVQKRAQHLADLQNAHHLGPKKMAEELVKEATEQVVEEANKPK